MSETDDLVVSWSIFPHIHTAQISARAECTWGEFTELLEYDVHPRRVVDKHRDNYLITIGTFAGGLWRSKKSEQVLDCPNGIRDNWHLQTCTMVGLDYDEKVLTPEEYSRRVAGFAHLIYSTHSHTSNAPKFRVFHPVSRPMVWLPDAYDESGIRVEVAGEFHEYRHTARELLNQFFPDHNFDSASTDCVRGFYAPCHNAARPDDAFCRVEAGRPLPVDTILDRVLPLWRAARTRRCADMATWSTEPRLEDAERYCAAISTVRHETLIPVGSKLFREFGGAAVRPVWERCLAVRYVPSDKTRTFTADDRERMWTWIVNNNKERNG